MSFCMQISIFFEAQVFFMPECGIPKYNPSSSKLQLKRLGICLLCTNVRNSMLYNIRSSDRIIDFHFESNLNHIMGSTTTPNSTATPLESSNLKIEGRHY